MESRAAIRAQKPTKMAEMRTQLRFGAAAPALLERGRWEDMIGRDGAVVDKIRNELLVQRQEDGKRPCKDREVEISGCRRRGENGDVEEDTKGVGL